jgi:predicted NACHT family NTPase
LSVCAIESSQDFAHAHACSEALNSTLVIALDAGFQKSLQQLNDQFPNPQHNQKQFQVWWQAHYANWIARLKVTIAHYRSINHHWQFSVEQQQVLQRYYDANQLLLDCLHSNCEVTPSIRQEIEATLLLPQKELEEREWQ